ncbi:MAG: COR domain-containing protein [Phormidesmis sp.]
MLDMIYFVNRWSKPKLNLSNLKLESISPKLFELDRIRILNLSKNNLIALPPELKNLKSLEILDLSNNQLDAFPSPSCLPPSLKSIILRGNKISEVDFRGQAELPSLLRIDLENNKVSAFYGSASPQSNLKELNLRGNKLRAFHIAQSRSIQALNLSANGIRNISFDVHPQTQLKQLSLSKNGLTSFPSFILKCSQLELLDLSANKLTALPDDLSQRLARLERLLLNDNAIADLPNNLYFLAGLQELQLSKNKFRILSPEISRLPQIKILEAFDNPLESPPKAVSEQGSSATIRFLKEIDVQGITGEGNKLWTSKLMVVGEGGVGKTSLVKALKGEAHDSSEFTTHGIQLDSIDIKHPHESSVQMNLNIWDFGGQQIYHATHQFFLTDNSIFIFAWNARTEFNQGRPYYWLDMITANAQNAPIVLVATHLDQRRELIPLDYLQEKYPQIKAFIEVSNLDRQGIEFLYAEIRALAADLPLMGKPWPKRWGEATEALKTSSKKIISRQQMMEVFRQHSLDRENSEVLAKYLHDLGTILQYPDSDALKDYVILNPQWISEYISKVITSDSLLDNKGLLDQTTISDEWADLTKPMQELFLELMEQYDLAYKVPGNSEYRAIIVEQLNPDRPQEYQQWKQLLARKDLKKVEIEYRLSSMQPGLPTWFIARSHRFSTGVHWRSGAIFADSKEQKNHALIESFDQEKLIRLTVVGISPHNFLSILKDGLELTFDRYPGMKVRGFVPCPTHDDAGACEGRFPHEKLGKALDRGLSSMQCQSCFEQIEIQQLLFGIGGSSTELFTKIEEKVGIINDLLPEQRQPSQSVQIQAQSSQFDDQVFLIHQINRIVYQAVSQLNETQSSEFKEIRKMLTGISDNFDLLHRRFNAQFKAIQGSQESHCPSTFLFKSSNRRENIIANAPLELHLLCQNPKHIHPATTVIGGGKAYKPYIIKRPKEWFMNIAPYIKAIVQLVSYAPMLPSSPLAQAADLTEKCLEDMESLLQQIEQFSEGVSLPTVSTYDDEISVDGAQLRAFRSLLDEVDTTHEWQGLKKWLSPEGHYLWLCPYHYEQCSKHFNE